MQLNRSPAVNDVIVKNNSIDEEKSLQFLNENVQIILNTESTLCLLFVCFYAPLYYLLLACMF